MVLLVVPVRSDHLVICQWKNSLRTGVWIPCGVVVSCELWVHTENDFFSFLQVWLCVNSPIGHNVNARSWFRILFCVLVWMPISAAWEAGSFCACLKCLTVESPDVIRHRIVLNKNVVASSHCSANALVLLVLFCGYSCAISSFSKHFFVKSENEINIWVYCTGGSHLMRAQLRAMKNVFSFIESLSAALQGPVLLQCLCFVLCDKRNHWRRVEALEREDSWGVWLFCLTCAWLHSSRQQKLWNSSPRYKDLASIEWACSLPDQNAGYAPRKTTGKSG